MSSNRAFSLASLVAGGAILAIPVSAQAEVTGNVGVVSQYIFRGGVEDGNTAFQGGLDYSHDSGLYAGTWFSTLDYGSGDPDTNNEIDLYAGYSGSTRYLSYDVGLLYYLYTGDGPTDDDANVPEGYVSLSPGAIGPADTTVGLTTSVALADASWTAGGDTYVSLGFDQPLPMDFTLSGSVGYYFYAGDTELSNGSVVTPKRQDSAFRDATVSLSHPLAATGVDMSINYTVGGEFRDRTDIPNHFWAGATFTF